MPRETFSPHRSLNCLKDLGIDASFYFTTQQILEDRPLADALTAQLFHSAKLQRLNAFLAERERRFGEVKRFLGDLLEDDLDPNESWQNVMTQLLSLFPESYSYRRNPHSELVQYFPTE